MLNRFFSSLFVIATCTLSYPLEDLDNTSGQEIRPSNPDSPAPKVPEDSTRVNPEDCGCEEPEEVCLIEGLRSSSSKESNHSNVADQPEWARQRVLEKLEIIYQKLVNELKQLRTTKEPKVKDLVTDDDDGDDDFDLEDLEQGGRRDERGDKTTDQGAHDRDDDSDDYDNDADRDEDRGGDKEGDKDNDDDDD